MEDITINIQYDTQRIAFQLPLSSTLCDLQSHIHAQTNVLPNNQKLYYKQKPSKISPTDTLTTLRIHENITIKLVGPSEQSLTTITNLSHKVDIIAARSANAPKAFKDTSSGAMNPYTFHSLAALPQFSDAQVATNLLKKMKTDYGIINIMKKYQWSVGVLSELHPAEKTILGFNRNKGHQISIRLRTDDLQGFRHYPTIISVLLHELSHMVHSEHDENFHQLNRELNKEYKKWTTAHTIDGSRISNDIKSIYEDEEVDARGYTGGTFVLGGENKHEGKVLREVIERAVMRRLSKEEEELVEGCGNK